LTHIAHNPTLGIGWFWIRPFAGLIFIMMIHGDKTVGRLRRRETVEEENCGGVACNRTLLGALFSCMSMHTDDDEA
jgi:hypothetical protein